MVKLGKILFACCLLSSLCGCSSENEGSTSMDNPEFDVYSANDLLSHLRDNKNINLKSDIDLTDISWPLDVTYNAILDGRGHKISNLKLETSSQKANIGFISINEGTIQNITFEDAEIKVTTEASDVGVICGRSGGNLNNINVTGKIDASVCTSVGGVTGYVYGSASNLTSDVEIKGLSKVGGVIGAWSIEQGTIDNLVNYSPVSGGDSVGGVFGYVQGIKGIDGYTLTISNCKNHADVNGNAGVGGIVGYNTNSCSDYGTSFAMTSFLFCENEGKITGTNEKVGGIAGEAMPADILNCKNSGDISGAGRVAGIIGYKPTIGYFQCDRFYASNCVNEGDIVATTSGNAGGLFSRAGRINDCANYGNVTALMNGANVGGISALFGIGDNGNKGLNYISDDAKVFNLKNTGNITGGNSTGGIFGDVEGRPNWYTVSKLFNEGTVSGLEAVGGIFGGILSGYQPIGPSADYTNGMSLKVLYSENSGRISGKNYVYGIIGNYGNNRLETKDEHRFTNVNSGDIVAEGADYGEIYK